MYFFPIFDWNSYVHLIVFNKYILLSVHDLNRAKNSRIHGCFECERNFYNLLLITKHIDHHLVIMMMFSLYISYHLPTLNNFFYFYK